MNWLRRVRFNLWYFRRPPWDSGISPPELLDFISSHAPGRAIDLGCGTGTNVLALAQNGWQVTGVDFAPRAIKLARRKLRAANVHADLRLGDVTELGDVAGPFDLALDLGCYHGVRDRTAYLTQLKRVLAPGGSWLMYGIFGSARFRSGLQESDIALVRSQGYRLLWRKDGMDRRERPSAWFLFQKE